MSPLKNCPKVLNHSSMPSHLSLTSKQLQELDLYLQKNPTGDTLQITDYIKQKFKLQMAEDDVIAHLNILHFSHEKVQGKYQWVKK